MPRHAASPAPSENEVDILTSLVEDSDGIESRPKQHPDRKARMEDSAMPDLGFDSGSDDAEIGEMQMASNRKSSKRKGKTLTKGGGFQVMGLNGNLLKAITRKGFSVPTPIQRKTIPMIMNGQDVVGMARTGSGKTAAFVVPMIEKLRNHSTVVGARALILSPSRELALQTLKVVKELGKGSDLRCCLLVGGDSLDEQFGVMAGNPDIIIATPGRFLHLKVEMKLDLSSIRYVVFDEADRLFEMGFATQLMEILVALPTARQTLLFSATLPKSLVEFARAGLQEPTLIRLDADSKISPQLQSAFFSVKSAEKEGALLHIVQEVIHIPTGLTEAALRAQAPASGNEKKRKRDEGGRGSRESPTKHSTIVFTATKHHVEYIATLLRASGFAVSHAYGSLDQTARRIQVQDFRSGMSHILVVTDVAARGIDIPILANVINYDFPAQPKVFVHRVGRTARAGQSGWSYSLVQESDCPYLLDLQLFLGKSLVVGRQRSGSASYTENVVVGNLPRNVFERHSEAVTKLLNEDADLAALRKVATKGEKLYLRTRSAASSESAKRAKEVVGSQSWAEMHPLFNDDTNGLDIEREQMIARVSGFRPQESVFEIGKKGTQSEAAEVMKRRRSAILAKREKRSKAASASDEITATTESRGITTQGHPDQPNATADVAMDSASDDELEVTFSHPANSTMQSRATTQDQAHFMSYTPSAVNIAEDRGYGVHSGGSSSFVQAARTATLDLTTDDGAKAFAEPSRAKGMRWDKKNKKYVARVNDEDGSKGAKMIRGESGQKIAASFRSGRYDAWRKANRADRFPRTGEAEKAGAQQTAMGLKKYRHTSEKAPKEADKYRDDYYKRKKMVEAAKERRVGRFRDGAGKREIKGMEDMRKERRGKEQRKEKTARPRRRG